MPFSKCSKCGKESLKHSKDMCLIVIGNLPGNEKNYYVKDVGERSIFTLKVYVGVVTILFFIWIMLNHGIKEKTMELTWKPIKQ